MNNNVFRFNLFLDFLYNVTSFYNLLTSIMTYTTHYLVFIIAAYVNK